MRTKKTILVVGLGLLALLIAYIGATADRIEYFYFDVAGSEVDDRDWQKPDISLYFGDKVPVKSTVNWKGRDLRFLDVNSCCVPELKIESPVPLSNMIVTTGKYVASLSDPMPTPCPFLYAEAEDKVHLLWSYWPKDTGMASCIGVGDEVRIELVPKNGSDSLVVHVVLARSGFYWRGHHIF